MAGPARALRPQADCDARYRRWRADGTWERLLAVAPTRSDAIGHLDWDIQVDATVVRAQ